MSFELDITDHEHAFFYDEDPRFLICRCGQYARRSRTDHGQPIIKLIDPPTPILVVPPRASSTASTTTSAAAEPRIAQRDAVGA